jgi:SPOR domain
MAAPTNTPSTEDIWHLNIEDLFAPLPEKARLGGPGPFVINLSASSAPIDVPVKGIAGCPHAHVYQVQRIEDRRPRYRLRVGPFAQEDDADAELLKVRAIYPSALTATADADDLRIIASLQAKAPAPPPAKVAKQVETPVVATLVKAVAKQAEASMVPILVEAVARQAVAPPAAPASVKAVATQVEAPMVLTLVEEATKPVEAPVVRTSVAAAKQAIPAMVPVIARAPLTQQKPAVRVPVAPQAERPSPRALSLESTQTVRALTQLELEDDQASRWFAIQLSLAEEAFDPETLPNLDIFRVYRLYSVAGIDQGRIVHALRLGFFSEQSAAGAVASYLTAFYDKPTIKRVSSAERERFAEQSLEARKDVGATGRQAVIEITDERYIREKRIGLAAAK